tara:strand:+ start:3503 stop:3673 length:171 start_codon:yes stop_codon:yes gene_type:complete
MNELELSKLKDMIREIYYEVTKELEEMTSTASVGGYNIPFAFKKSGKKRKKIDDKV